MERSTPVVTGMGEQSLTPGEQRILSLMEQGQQRLEQRLDGMDQRLQSLEEGQKRTDQQFLDLTLKVDKEAAANKMRDRQLSTELQELREQNQGQKVWFHGEIERVQHATLTSVFQEINALRTTLTARLDQHNTRLEVIERTLELHGAHIQRNTQAIEGLQADIRTLMKMVEGLVQAQQPPRMASAP